jgi:hypothetical protein
MFSPDMHTYSWSARISVAQKYCVLVQIQRQVLHLATLYVLCLLFLRTFLIPSRSTYETKLNSVA